MRLFAWSRSSKTIASSDVVDVLNLFLPAIFISSFKVGSSLSKLIISNGYVMEARSEGYLLKKGAKNTLSWKKRWFVLNTDGTAAYYKADDKRDLMGTIQLKEAAIKDSSALEFSFDIVTSNRAWHLKASSKEEMDSWIRTLQKMCDNSPVNDAILQAECFIMAASVRKHELPTVESIATCLPSDFSSELSIMGSPVMLAPR